MDNKIIKIVIPIVALVLVVSICIFIGIAYIKPKDNKKPNLGISNELVKDKTYLSFSDRMVDIVFLDQEEKEIGRVPTFISQIEHGGAIRIDTVIDKKSAKAHNFRVEG